MDWEGCGFVSKTIVYPPRDGNMPFRNDKLTPRERFIPRSVVVKPISGHVLNAVGLSGPGAEWAFETGRWQQRSDNFMISFMSVAGSADERLCETKQFAQLMQKYLPDFGGNVAIQANRGCPNSGHIPEEFYEETDEMLNLLGELDIPVVVNFNPTVPGSVMKRTADHEVCDGLWIGNTIPWGDPRVNWEALFGKGDSPLLDRKLNVPGGGGLSGPACLPHTVERVIEARNLGITKPIVTGNGIQKPSDVKTLKNAGADGVAIGIVAMLRPWRIKKIIRTAQKI